ncbi:putative quinol monooxygenase [Ruminococcus flavefaciens]|jgi:quinol monooxygenase YgiN|uniref:Quinol monooxygenase YgiN n=1 Tax=Ruminococcus flavefaciens TaxID=1265 RepID=A0A1K1PI01_RUMFL|nr:putative quinol monooxygenase [Ruminococcus flavefaciens]SFW47067.1 Quinol monooxygenase YgiN [Ruminococcus flavefaciens]SHM74726.1 Quinol monooxygenase YgiN [Ruminococcus flavefaciens]
MSIIVNLRYTGKSGSARAFAEEMTSSGTVDVIRNENGNLRYEYYLSFDDPETVLLIDEWTDQAAIDRHHASPMMQKITELRDKYDLHMTVERYVSDEGGIPDKDEEFIRK